MKNYPTASPIREQTQFLDEMTALRMEFEKNQARLYEQQTDFKAAWRIVWQLIDAGAPADLNVIVTYDRSSDSLYFYCFGQNSVKSGSVMEALKRTHLIDECLVRPSEQFENMLDIVFANHPLLLMYCPKQDIVRLPEAA